MNSKFLKSGAGFTLIEIVIGIALMIIVFLGVYAAFYLGMQAARQSKTRVSALALANQRIEQIRNQEYGDIGTEGGIPPGNIPQTEVINRNNIAFDVQTTIVYIDDSFDDLAPVDIIPTDYKRVKVKVSWTGWKEGEVILITDISPKSLESEVGKGTLKIIVLDAWGKGVSQADVHIFNEEVSPIIDANYQTDDDGELVLVGAPTSTEAYKINVSKEGFNEDRTYGRDEVATPDKSHASVSAEDVTEIAFGIDEISTLEIETRARESFDDDFANASKLSDWENILVENSEVTLSETPSGGQYNPSGYAESVEVSPSGLINWDWFEWEDSEPESTDVRYQFFYATATNWKLVPNNEIPDNLVGLDSSPVDLSGLSPIEYPKLKVKATLTSPGQSVTPVIYDWHFIYNTPLIANVAFRLQGLKIIGTDSEGNKVHKYSENHVSNLTGRLELSSVEWDSYNFSVATSSPLDLMTTEPSPQPINLYPGTTSQVSLYLSAENSLLVKVKNNSTTTDPIFGVTVRLFSGDLDYEEIKPTDENGTAFFIPLEAETYNLEITSEDYCNVSTTLSIAGHVIEELYLERISEE